MSIETHRYRADIDGLRALAIVPVVFFHAGIPGFSGGFVGVDVFFVISGYLITSIIEREIGQGRFSLVAFYERRVRRILPTLFAMMAACVLVSPFLLYPEEYRRFARSLISATLFVSSIQFRQESGYFDADAHGKPLLHTWSLSVEEIFYVVYPMAMLLLWRWAGDRRSLVLAGAALLSFAASVWALLLDAQSSSAFYLAHFRAWELLIGALLALSAVKPPQHGRTADAMSVAGVLLIGLAVLGYSETTVFPGLAALVPCLGAALIILAGQRHPSLGGRVLSRGPIVFTGLISYSLYLWHWPILVFAGLWMGRRPSALEGASLAVASFALAALSWRYVERPFRGKSGVLSRPALFGASAGVGAALVAVGLHGEVTKGWLSRYPEALGAVLAARDDRDPRQKQCLSTKPNAGGCIYGKAGATPTMALWGDSHAAIYAVMLGRLAGEKGDALLSFTMPACPPVVGWQIATQKWRESCARFQDLAIGTILEIETIRTVVLAANFVDHVAASREQHGLREALRDAVDRLLQAGKRVVVVYPIPVLGPETLKHLSHAAADGEDLERLGQPLDAYLRASSEAFGLLDDLGERPGLVRVRPQAGLCDDRRCAVYLKDRALYSDYGHLSLSGTELLAPLFAEALGHGREMAP